jgi:hypothetical protein
MLKFKKSEIHKLANQLTCNSELFGDEVASVIAQLTSLSNSANEFGCTMEGKIFDCWCSSVSVIALPDKAKHSWEF